MRHQDVVVKSYMISANCKISEMFNYSAIRQERADLNSLIFLTRRTIECGTDANRCPDILAPSPPVDAGQGLPTRVAITAAITASTAAAILIFAVLMVIL